MEFSSQLATIARRSLRQVGATADVVEMDAGQFKFPSEPLIVYMYNPFASAVMQAFVKNLVAWRRANSNELFVIYSNPVCREQFDVAPEFQSIGTTDHARVWKLN